MKNQSETTDKETEGTQLMKTLLKKQYDLDVLSIEKSSVGAGSDTFFVTCKEGKFVLKFPSPSDINNPQLEPELCELLLSKGISVCKFIKNKSGAFLSLDENERVFHLQEFIEGKTYDWNTAPDSLLDQSARTLGKIHAALRGVDFLPVGIGEDFFRYMTPENALRSYENTLETSRKNKDSATEHDLLYRIELMKRFPKYCFDLDKLTLSATHGDYFISQLICGDDGIKAVIDWTTACVHPVVWEIMRSYVYAAPECARGEIDIKKLRDYFDNYRRFSQLSSYDLENALAIFYYQIAVCDYYNQYYCSDADNRDIYLRQAIFSTRLLRWFEKNEDKLREILK